MALSRWKIMAGMLAVSIGGLATVAANCPKSDAGRDAKNPPETLALADPPAIPAAAPPAADKKSEPLAPTALPSTAYPSTKVADYPSQGPYPSPGPYSYTPGGTPLPPPGETPLLPQTKVNPPMTTGASPVMPIPAPMAQIEPAKDVKKAEGAVAPAVITPPTSLGAPPMPAFGGPTAPLVSPPAPTLGGPSVGLVEPPLTGKPNVTPPTISVPGAIVGLTPPASVAPAPVTPAANVTPASPSGPAIVPASSLSPSTKLRIVLRVGEGEPTFEVRSGDDLLMKVICEKVDVSSPEKGTGLSAVKARGKVHFAGFGAEGTCDELAFLAGTGEVTMTGSVKIQVKDKLGRVESELICDTVKYRVDASAIGGMLKP